MQENSWLIVNERCDAHTLAQFNSVFTISNGYLGLKGNLQEDRDGACPVTLVNGVYDELNMFGLLRPSRHERPWLDPAYFDDAGKSPAIANLPDPLFVRTFVGDREVALGRGAISGFRQEFDLRCGLYTYSFDLDDDLRKTRIAMWRFASLRHAHRVYMRYRITSGGDVPIRILTGINAAVHSNVTGERQFSLVETRNDVKETPRMRVRTPARGHIIDIAVVNRLVVQSGLTGVRDLAGHDAVYTEYELCAKSGQPITIDRFVTLSTSEDARHGERLEADPTPDVAARQGFDAALAEQKEAWETPWERADVQIEGDDSAQLYLRFALHHLLAAAPRFSDRLSVPVKLLTGEHYQGNTFYDTDLYIVPFYTFTLPEYARTCLNFRWAGLEAGRQVARDLGCAWAKLAWQAGPYGEECLGRWYRFVHTNIHINADVAYSLMQYWRATGDDEFLAERGIDMLVESARFYISRVVYDAQRDAYDIHHVAGPDEAHCDSTNNFYTNYLTARTLHWAAEVATFLRDRQSAVYEAAVRRLGIDEAELQRWQHVAQRLTLLFDLQTKLYEQCAGFYDLPPAPADLLSRGREWFVPLARYQALNQPDVLMAMALFRDEFDDAARRANWDYYKDKSLDFSSMSFAIHAIMAADLGELDTAYRNWLISAGMDLDETLTGRGDTADGLHGTALGGAWLAAVFGFGGVHWGAAGLHIDPNLPPAWDALRFQLAVRGARVRVAIDRRETVLTVEGEAGWELPVRVMGQKLTLKDGGEYRVPHRA